MDLKQKLQDMCSDNPTMYFNMLRDGFDIILDNHDMAVFEEKLIELSKTDKDVDNLLSKTIEQWELDNPTKQQLQDWELERQEQERNYLKDVKVG